MTAAFVDVQKNPENAAKYENNPKVKKVMEKLSATLGAAGMGGAKMGGADPAPSAKPPPQPTSSKQPPPKPAMGAEMDLD